MRLLNAKTLMLSEFMSDDNTPPYAILSHTWGPDEFTYQDIVGRDPKQDKLGYDKIKYCCEQALKDGLHWAWVDTCCIDKTSSAELSEAINSMFRWYQQAQVCYVYLTDVSEDKSSRQDELSQSRWFTRSWTLQELIAPRFVIFYTKNWEVIGSKEHLSFTLSKITGIDEDILCGANLELVSAAKKMSWAASRQATRKEDVAYSLLGLFDINMPLLYGEGQKAFIRLQEEILRTAYDHSLFVWRFPSASLLGLGQFANKLKLGYSGDMMGLLADSPAAFKESQDVVSMGSWGHLYTAPPVVHNKCVYVDLPVLYMAGETLAVLDCRLQNEDLKYLAIPLRVWGSGAFYARLPDLIIVPSELLRFGEVMDPKDMESLRVKAPSLNAGFEGCFVFKDMPPESSGYRLRSTHKNFGAIFDKEALVLRPEKHARGAQAVFVFGDDLGHRFAIVLAQYVRGLPSRGSVAYVKVLSKASAETEEELQRYLCEVNVAGGNWASVYLDKESITLIGSTGLQIRILSQLSRCGPTEVISITEYAELSHQTGERS